jgi:hypothetical protein
LLLLGPAAATAAAAAAAVGCCNCKDPLALLLVLLAVHSCRCGADSRLLICCRSSGLDPCGINCTINDSFAPFVYI